MGDKFTTLYKDEELRIAGFQEDYHCNIPVAASSVAWIEADLPTNSPTDSCLETLRRAELALFCFLPLGPESQGKAKVFTVN